MKRKIIAPVFALGCLFCGYASADFGIEAETMAFLNKGYHGSVWYGAAGKRVRLVYSRVTYPGPFNPEGFTNMTSRFKEIEFDFFVGDQRNHFRGLWIAIGGGQTDMSIESKTSGATANIVCNDLHSGIGYAVPVQGNFYINPWIGADMHLNAPEQVRVGTETWNPRKIDLVGGMKLGFEF